MSQTVTVDSMHDSATGTWQYIVADPHTLDAVIIDPVLDYDISTHTISTHTADGLKSLIEDKGYKIIRILETHAHADHLTAASYLQTVLERDHGSKPPICIGKRIREVQRVFGQRYGVYDSELNAAFDQLMDDDEEFCIGQLKAKTIHLPGHTPDHVGYLVEDNIFCGDSVFNADLGTARCDFPGGSAKDLYHSTRKLLSLPDNYKIWTGHDYPSNGRMCPVPYMSVADQKQRNRYLSDIVSEQDFLHMRTQRDAQLKEPKMLHPSLQINIRGGRLPAPMPSGERTLTFPIRLETEHWGV
ncbi:hypothetical protein WHR41_09234 [Cladosporium halotolerans]|uniref:Metallo-beta-lactamase domain-containing protein n=1 Tax=Cladosporium halotolerans TaxID=1052096 RepID=A0AB34KEE1_9PEZI